MPPVEITLEDILALLEPQGITRDDLMRAVAAHARAGRVEYQGNCQAPAPRGKKGELCGKPIFGVSWKMYCDHTCAKRAWRRSKKEKEDILHELEEEVAV